MQPICTHTHTQQQQQNQITIDPEESIWAPSASTQQPGCRLGYTANGQPIPFEQPTIETEGSPISTDATTSTATLSARTGEPLVSTEIPVSTSAAPATSTSEETITTTEDPAEDTNSRTPEVNETSNNEDSPSEVTLELEQSVEETGNTTPAQTRIAASKAINDVLIAGDSHALHWPKAGKYKSIFPGAQNIAERGQKTNELRDKLTILKKQTQIRHLVVSIGTNDATRDLVESATNAMRRVAKIARDKCPNAHIHFMDIPEKDPHVIKNREHNRCARQLNDAIDELRREQLIKSVIRPNTNKEWDIWFDDKHYNTKFNNEVVIPEISRILKLL